MEIKSFSEKLLSSTIIVIKYLVLATLIIFILTTNIIYFEDISICVYNSTSTSIIIDLILSAFMNCILNFNILIFIVSLTGSTLLGVFKAYLEVWSK